jgi:hypothetical protein
MSDWRGLCAELLSALEQEGYAHWSVIPDEDELCLRARAALAQPAPETSRLRYCDVHGQQPENAWGCPKCVREMRHQLAQPEPEGLTEDDMNDLADDLLGIVLPEGSGARLITRALQLWGSPPIEPVAVSERLPGPEDCDAEGRCWWFMSAHSVGIFRQSSSWCLGKRVAEDFGIWTHWLPHWALPVPTSQETANA